MSTPNDGGTVRQLSRRSAIATTAITAALLAVSATVATAHPDDGGPEVVTDDPTDEAHNDVHFGGDAHDFDIDGPLLGQDEFDVISGGPYSKVEKNLAVAGRGERLEANVTTDVWAHDGYAYTGTFSTDCSDGTAEDESGIWIWDVHNKNKPSKVGVIISPVGTKANDVKVITNTAGNDILVFSNEICGAGGVGGVMVYDVTDPANPVEQSRIVVDDANVALRDAFGVADTGVHNMYLWSRGGVDYVGVSGEADFGNFQIFDITDPTAPQLVSTWGPENAEFAADLAAFGLSSFAEGDLGFWLGDGFDLLVEADSWIFNGYGASANRVMHDLFINEDGTKAYVNFWDAGMVLLDITDPANPVYISTALDVQSTDGEVNSHSVWTEDDVIVVEGEEDFAPYENVLVTSAGNFDAVVGNINTSGAAIGDAAYVGLACNGDPLPTAGETGASVALIQRGVCAFTEKGNNVAAAGYASMVVFNDEARGDALVTMGGDPVGIPGVFIGHSEGLTLAGVADDSELVVGASADTVEGLQSVWNGWSGLRIWDYSDPANPVLASTFDTACSALEPGTEGAEDCLEGGTYSSHNLVIEDGIAYISWYADGVLVVDVSDPYNPVEVGRYHERGDAFDAQNAGAQDIWGVYKIENEPWVYASDRNGGLYVLKAYGQGSAKNGKAASGS